MLKENCAMFSVKVLASMILALLVFAGAAVAEAQAGLLRAHTAFHEALRDADASALDWLLDENFTWTHTDGLVQSKADLLVKIGDGKLRYSELRTDQEIFKAHPDADLGLHLTFTSEWQGYRWGPITSRALVGSLVGPDGYFYASTKEFVEHAKLDEVEMEIHAQIERAKSMGLEPSHLDSHMHALYATPELFGVFLKVAHEYKLPIRMARNDQPFQSVLSLMAPGDPVPDAIYSPGADVSPSGWNDYYVNLIKSLQPGVTEVFVHLAHDDVESQAIIVDRPDWGAAWRQREFAAM
jgi:predicted glycoside hydrolase/deacetylase ChbG (UPF0249 family)